MSQQPSSNFPVFIDRLDREIASQPIIAYWRLEPAWSPYSTGGALSTQYLGGAAKKLLHEPSREEWQELVNLAKTVVIPNAEQTPQYLNLQVLLERSGLNPERWRLFTDSKDIETIGADY